MTRNTEIARAVRYSLLVGAVTVGAAASLPAQAQAQSTDQDSTALTTVVVTGSRIQSSANLVSISPVTTVTALDIQQTGLTRVEDMLNNLPMVFAGQGSTLSNGSDGTATVDLHDLGPERTLVLVNGRRLGPGSADGRNFSDVNQIPAQLIERVEVLTGGASAVYGADAVSGVVNFIMNTKFEGVKIDVNYGMNQHDNHESGIQGIVSGAGDALPSHSVDTGFTKDLAFLAGSNFADGKGNATFYATYTDQAAVAQSKFDYSACTLAAGSPAPHCGGSATSAGGLFLAYNAAGKQILYNTVDPKTGAFRAFGAQDLYNYGPLNYYQRPDERYTGGSFINYDVNEHVNVYAELMFTRNTSTSQIAPSGDFASGLVPVNCATNPLLTAQERSTICSASNLAGQPAGTAPGTVGLYILRRNVEGGGRQEEFTNESFREVIGVKGDINDTWNYDAYASYDVVNITDSNLNYFSNANLANALNVVAGPGGVPTCTSVVNGSDPACVPYNIWVPGGVTKAATNYLSIPLQQSGAVTEQVASASMTGDLGKYGVKFPTAASGLKINVGTEYREEKSSFNPDLATELGEGAGGSGPTPPVSGEFHVAEAYTELRMPIMENMPFADEVAVEAGYRYSDYTLGFNTNTYKLGLEWAPIKDIRARASYNRAVRAPNIGDLYTPLSVGPDGSTDPCWGAHPTLSATQCARTGVSATEYGNVGANPADQFNEQLGGNSTLTPEVADTYSYGFVFQPQFLPGATMSLDYYDIKIKNAILSDPGTAVLLSCALENAASACDAIHRGLNGSLWLSQTGFVNVQANNAGFLETKDIDIKMAYRFDVGSYGKLLFNLEGTDVLDNVTQLFVGGPTYDCAGYYGVTCGNPLPRWRHVFSADWSTPWTGLDLTARWRFFGATRVDALSGSPLLSNPAAVYPGYERISNYSYLDLSAALTVAKNVTLRLGVNNVLDKDPPIVLSGNCAAGPCNGNTFSQTYDVLGRYLYAHLTAQF